MSDSEIPELRPTSNPRRAQMSLRWVRPGLVGEDRADKIIQSTDQDASVSRLSAVEIGYLEDPFAKAFVPSQFDRAKRRLPIINRGTYVRTSAIDNLVLRFLKADGIKRQIISLGAGSDTRYFRLQKSKEYSPDTFVYHELDFKTITTSKISTITQNQNIFQCIPGDIQIPGDSASLHSPTYHIHPVDLRWPSLSEEPVDPSGKLQPLEFIDFSLSTLLISECCLIYLEPAAADAVLDYFAGIFPPETPLGLILYEPLNPFDSFGKVMVSNLASRGIVLRTLRKYHSLEIQKARLQTYGFAENAAADVEYLWEHWTGEDEKQRVAALEMVDEVEEWQLLAQHYCVVWGRRSEHDETWTGWRNLKD